MPQVAESYPNLHDVFAEKRRVDHTELFTNALYATYGAPGSVRYGERVGQALATAEARVAAKDAREDSAVTPTANSSSSDDDDDGDDGEGDEPAVTTVTTVTDAVLRSTETAKEDNALAAIGLSLLHRAIQLNCLPPPPSPPPPPSSR